jgi:hypothetical protein
MDWLRKYDIVILCAKKDDTIAS